MNRPPTRWLFFMSGETIDQVMALINATDVQVGSLVKNTAGTAGVSASALYADTNKNLASGGVVPFISGVTSTSAAIFSVEGSATGSANELMHQTLVLG